MAPPSGAQAKEQLRRVSSGGFIEECPYIILRGVDMTKAKACSVGLVICSLLLSILAIKSSGGGNASKYGIPSTLSARVQDISGSHYCRYMPEWPVFKKGEEIVQHPRGHSGQPNEPGTEDIYEILLPNVKRQTTPYEQIKLYRGDELRVGACGCVQTGGTGMTWKRYVNPGGPNSDKLYHGLIWVPKAAELKLPTSPILTGFVRIEDLMAAQNRGFRLRIDIDSYLILGYEDDDYSDNGYWGHDDGTGGQCKDVGGATVTITIRHGRK
jgi:hypothetical protein